MPTSVYSPLDTIQDNLKLFATRAKMQPSAAIIALTFLVASVALCIFGAIGLLPFFIGITLGIYALILSSSPLFVIALNPITDDKLFDLFRKSHTLEHVQRDSVVLILRAKHDHNGALKADQRTIFKRIEREGKHELVFADIESIEDIKKVITLTTNANKKIKALWLNAHGCPTAIALCKNTNGIVGSAKDFGANEGIEYLDLANVHQLRDAFQKLEPDAPIILDSCKTAGKAVNQDNIATWISWYADQRKVYATKSTCSIAGFLLKDPKSLRVEFYRPSKVSNSSIKILRKFWKFIYGIRFTLTPRSNRFSGFHRNVTAILVAGRPVS